MNAFEIGQNVKIIGPAHGGSKLAMSQVGKVRGISSKGYRVHVGSYRYPPASLKPITTATDIQKGDQVRVVLGESNGTIGTIERLWASEGVLPLYELASKPEMLFYRAELEVIRTPRSGEVWKVDNLVCLITEEILNAEFRTRLLVIDHSGCWLTKPGGVYEEGLNCSPVFLAPDLATYFAQGGQK